MKYGLTAHRIPIIFDISVDRKEKAFQICIQMSAYSGQIVQFSFRNRLYCILNTKSTKLMPNLLKFRYIIDIFEGKGGQIIQNRKEHILACISEAPHSELVLDIANTEAAAHHADKTAVLIETSSTRKLSATDRRIIKQNVRYAESLGFDIETLMGDDAASLITEFAKMCGATQIVLDRSTYKTAGITWHSKVPQKIGRLLPDVDLHIIPDHSIRTAHRASLPLQPGRDQLIQSTLSIFLVMFVTTLIGFAFHMLGFDENSIIPLYSVAVLLCCVEAPNWPVCIISTVLSILIFNYFFAYPGGSFVSVNPANWITYISMFITSVIIGLMASSLRQHSEKAARTAYREKILFDTNALLLNAGSRDEIIEVMLRQISKLTGKNSFYYKVTDGEIVHRFENNFLSTSPLDPEILDQEYPIVLKAQQRRVITGATTLGDTGSSCIYLPCVSKNTVMGILGIELKGSVLDPMEASVVKAVLGKGAMTGENLVLAAEMEEARTKAMNQELKASLLRALSHDLRTPLTSISGSLDSLIQNEDRFTEEEKHQICRSAYDNSIWLIGMVENLLSASRMENGDIDIHPSIEILDDIVLENVRSLSGFHTSHPTDVQLSDDLLVVRADTQMISRVLHNILTNAYEYTPEGTRVSIRTFQEDDYACVSICDEGMGIPPEQQKQIFEMFYNADSVMDTRRTMGLGLYLCSKIVEAHSGDISFCDNVPHGCNFTFRLPMADMSMIHE